MQSGAQYKAQQNTTRSKPECKAQLQREARYEIRFTSMSTTFPIGIEVDRSTDAYSAAASLQLPNVVDGVSVKLLGQENGAKLFPPSCVEFVEFVEFVDCSGGSNLAVETKSKR
jgi:hypothetical protein